MRARLVGVAVTIGIVAVVAAIVLAIMAHVRNVHACENAGGKVEQRYERTDVTFSYTYDSKGNVTSVTPVMTQVYSYHCWVQGQETNSW